MEAFPFTTDGSMTMQYAYLTVRRTLQTGTKVGHSDPVVYCGIAIAQRIKGTPGITG